MARPLLLAAILGAAAPALAGALLLEDGRVIDGRTVTGAEGGYLLRLDAGTILVPASRVRAADRDDARDSRVVNAISEARGRRLWRDRAKVESEHCSFESNLAPHVLARYRELAERSRAEVLRLLEATGPPESPRLAILLFHDVATFTRVTGGGPEGRGRYRFVPPREIDLVHDPVDPERSERHLAHLVVRATLDEMRPGFVLPDFPGLALADHLSGNFDGELSERLRMDLDAGRTPALRDVLAGGEDSGLRAWRWALVRLLESRREDRPRLAAFVRAVLSVEETVPGRAAG